MRPSLQDAITSAALATDWNGKRFVHQHRIKRTSLPEANATLLTVEARIVAATSFEDLLALVTSQLVKVTGVGELFYYDTALRIGSFLNLLPSKVHLHSGTRCGAKALGLPTNRDALELRELPEELWDRPAHEVEDILCIYKSKFTRSMGAT